MEFNMFTIGFAELLYSVLVLAAAVLLFLIPRDGWDSRRRRFAIAVSIFALVFYALFNWLTGWRSWRLEPVNVATLLLVWIVLIYRYRLRAVGSEKRGVFLLRRIGSTAAVLAVLLGLAMQYLFPVEPIAAPVGSYTVGTSAFELVDESRTGVYLDKPDQARRLMVQAWYPASAEGSGRPAGWIEDERLSAAFAAYAGLPAFAMNQLALVRSNSLPGAALAKDQERWPLVIISHGWTGSRFVHTDLAEDLASRGVVVLALDHSYGSLMVSFPDGTATPLYPDALPDSSNPEFAERSRFLVQTYAADIQALLAALRFNRLPAPLAGRIAADRIALAGHSTGGGAAVRVMQDDPSIAALVGLDAWLEPLESRVDQAVAVPQLHFGSAQWVDGKNRPQVERLAAAAESIDFFYINGSAHMDFAMLRHFTRAAQIIGWGGSIDQNLFAAIVNRAAGSWLAAQLGVVGPSAAEVVAELDQLKDLQRLE